VSAAEIRSDGTTSHSPKQNCSQQGQQQQKSYADEDRSGITHNNAVSFSEVAGMDHCKAIFIYR
jgi:hypothetical protein